MASIPSWGRGGPEAPFPGLTSSCPLGASEMPYERPQRHSPGYLRAQGSGRLHMVVAYPGMHKQGRQPGRVACLMYCSVRTATCVSQQGPTSSSTRPSITLGWRKKSRRQAVNRPARRLKKNTRSRARAQLRSADISAVYSSGHSPLVRSHLPENPLVCGVVREEDLGSRLQEQPAGAESRRGNATVSRSTGFAGSGSGTLNKNPLMDPRGEAGRRPVRHGSSCL
jgi:hypothetical protein